MALGVAPVTQEPDLNRSDATDADAGDKASPALSWVRPIAAVLLLLSAIAWVWMHGAISGSIGRSPPAGFVTVRRHDRSGRRRGHGVVRPGVPS